MKLKRFNEIDENENLKYKLAVSEFNIDINPLYENKNRRLKNFLIDCYEIKEKETTKFKISLIKSALDLDKNKFENIEEQYSIKNGDIKTIRIIERMAKDLNIDISDLEYEPYYKTLDKLYEGINKRFINYDLIKK
jgi:hypothetical protein